MTLGRWWDRGNGLGLGVLAAMGQAPLGLWPVSIAAFAVFAWHIAKSCRGFGSGWWFGFGYFLATMHWIVEPFLVEPERYGALAPFGLLFMAGGLALFWGLASWGAFRMGARLWTWPLLLTTVELTRAYIFTGFPWALPSYAVLDLPHAQLAAVLGPHALTGVFVFMASGFAAVMLGHARVPVALGMVCVVLGPLALPSAAPPVGAAAPMVRILQPNAPQDKKWNPEFREFYFRRLIQFSASPGDPDLIIWPESSVTQWLDMAADELVAIREASGRAEVVFGVQKFDQGRYFNSLVTLTPESYMPHQIYDKSHLVPFGEYMPFASVLARLGIFGLSALENAGFSAGNGPKILELPGAGRFQPLICYEGIFPHFVGATKERPEFLVLITNDAWFGDFAGPHQHLAQARFRAIEQGLPMVRAANTGISAVIDARGGLVGTLSLNESGYLDLALPPALPRTVYARTGDWPLVGVLCVALLGSFAHARRSRIDPPDLKA